MAKIQSNTPIDIVINGTTVFTADSSGIIITGSLASTTPVVSASYAETASYALNGGGSSVKAQSGSAVSFGGSPLTSSVTFTTPFSNNLYAITVTGEDARSWTIQSKASGSFVINSNSSVTLSGPVYWIATSFANS